MIGKVISHYTILEKLGEGGMGIVYKAEDTVLHRAVALKFLPPELARDSEARERFLHEARAAAALSHPNICTIHEIDDKSGDPFIAMEYISGPSLKEVLAAGPLEVDRAVKIAIQAADGLAAAHKHGIVHRDVKPSNIMIGEDGRVSIADFGLAKSGALPQLTREGTTLGTASYMSPEQAQGHPADHRSDIWSLGVVLYEMLSGRRPFTGEYEHAVMYSILHTDPEPLGSIRAGVPALLEAIVMRCIAKDPSKRYQSASDLISDLSRLQRETSTGGVRTGSGGMRGRRRDSRSFPSPMSRGLWLLILFVPLFAVLIINVIVPRYFSSEVAGPEARRKKLAVLPFENLGPAGDEYFADGITEELIARLAKIEGLGVISRTSVMQYKDTRKSIGTIGNELGVDYILEGTIRWQRMSNTQSRVRITPQLIRVADETHLWADVYQRDMTDIFQVQEEIAGNVARAMDVTLLEADRKGRQAAVPTEDPDAYRAYLEGRFWYNKRSQEGFDRAIELFEEAIRLDPLYALAYAAKAECYCMLAIHLARPAEYIATARQAADKALEIDPELAVAHTVLGWIAFVYDYDAETAERHFKRSLELDPNYATTYNWYGVMLAATGRGDEAVRVMTQGVQLDPASMIINRDFGCVLSWVGRLDDAQRQLEKTLEMDPDFEPALAHLARVYGAKGMYDEAFAVLDRLKTLDSEYFNLNVMLAWANARAGRMEESRRILGGLQESVDTQQGKAGEIAIVYAELGNYDEAFEWFDRAVRNREFTVVLIDVTVMLDDIREDPRYRILCGKIGLFPPRQ
jgi:serine/threonine-protein kinase